MKRIAKKVALAFSCLILMTALADYQVMAEEQEGYLAVTGPCHQTFPEDHGPHPGFRTEWWYYTGNLVAESGDRYGFQLTFFRSQISQWDGNKSWKQRRQRNCVRS